MDLGRLIRLAPLGNANLGAGATRMTARAARNRCGCVVAHSNLWKRLQNGVSAAIWPEHRLVVCCWRSRVRYRVYALNPLGEQSVGILRRHRGRLYLYTASSGRMLPERGLELAVVTVQATGQFHLLPGELLAGSPWAWGSSVRWLYGFIVCIIVGVARVLSGLCWAYRIQ